MIEENLLCELTNKDYLLNYKITTSPAEASYTGLLNRMIREEKVYCKLNPDLIISVDHPEEELKLYNINFCSKEINTISDYKTPEPFSCSNMNLEYLVESGDFNMMLGN